MFVWYKYNCNKQKVEGKTKRKKQDSIIILFFNYVHHVDIILITS